MVAFADDEALVVVAKDIRELEHFGDEAIKVLADWLSHHDLSLAAEKTGGGYRPHQEEELRHLHGWK